MATTRDRFKSQNDKLQTNETQPSYVQESLKWAIAFQSRGADAATVHQQALAALEQLVNTQAAVLPMQMSFGL
jgi:hypothetical protein